MLVFKNIPHVNRKIYRRTFMNEIVMLFTYNSVDMYETEAIIRHEVDSGAVNANIDYINNKSGVVLVKVNDAAVSFTHNSVFVSLPASEYKDFSRTTQIWDCLEHLLKTIHANPMLWSFTKGNRWTFSKAIPPEMKGQVNQLILSRGLLDLSKNNLYVEESIDKTKVFTCRYGWDKFGEKDSLGLKTMIAFQTYNLENLKGQIFEANELMFDVWDWSVSVKIKQFMDKEN